MRKIYYKLLLAILGLQKKFYTNKTIKVRNISYSESTSKTVMNGSCTLKLTSKTELAKAKVDMNAKNIVKQFIKTPEKLLEFVESKGTKVYKMNFADKILNLIGEQEGFVTPQQGIKALFLSLVIRLFADSEIKISLKTQELFLLRNLPVNIYIMANQFYKWYGFRMNLPGYDAKSQAKFKKLFKSVKDIDIERLTPMDILAIKEAIARDKESIDFVLGLTKEYEGAEKALNKIKNKEGANI